MKAALPEKKIDVPMHLYPESRYNIGGSNACRHHYSDASMKEFTHRVEWTCSNCDRICGFYKHDAYDKEKERT